MTTPVGEVDDRLRLAWCGLHPDRTRALLEGWGSAGAVLRAIAKGQVKASDRIRRAATADPQDSLRRLAEIGVAPVARTDPGFPVHLAELPDTADLLFVRGKLPVVPGVAVVGTRRCSRYGRSLARSFGAAIARAGWPLISGLARGIDGEAHRGTVEAGGIGVAVLGSGPDVWYPREHRSLGEDLLALGGAVVSEYPPGTPPEGWRFPPRNRIISGLSAAVVVVEAGVKGGALITAATAAEQGREVLVVPGDVDRESSVGCNLLIRDGAHPVMGSDDLIEALSLILGPPPLAASKRSPNRDPLVAALGTAGRTVDELAATLDRPAPEVLAEVTRLEAAGAVRVEGGVVMAAP